MIVQAFLIKIASPAPPCRTSPTHRSRCRNLHCRCTAVKGQAATTASQCLDIGSSSNHSIIGIGR